METQNSSPCKNVIFKDYSKRDQNPSRHYYNSRTNLKFSRNLLRENQKDFPKGNAPTSQISNEGSRQDNNLHNYLHGVLKQDLHRERAQIKYQSLFHEMSVAELAFYTGVLKHHCSPPSSNIELETDLSSCTTSTTTPPKTKM
jgi:hypothetical protein